jgi:hypothetical protein
VKGQTDGKTMKGKIARGCCIANSKKKKKGGQIENGTAKRMEKRILAHQKPQTHDNGKEKKGVRFDDLF